LIYYYNGKYGKGKLSKILTMKGHLNYNLGQRILRDSVQYMINGQEYEDNVESRTKIKKRTYLNLFEVLNVD